VTAHEGSAAVSVRIGEAAVTPADVRKLAETVAVAEEWSARHSGKPDETPGGENEEC